MIDELPPLPAPALKIQRAYGEEEGFYSDVHMSHYALVVYHMRDAEVADLRAERDALLKDAERFTKLGGLVAFGSWSVIRESGYQVMEASADDLDHLREMIDVADAIPAGVVAAMASSSKEGK